MRALRIRPNECEEPICFIFFPAALSRVAAELTEGHAAQIKGLHQTGDFFWGGAQIKASRLPCE